MHDNLIFQTKENKQSKSLSDLIIHNTHEKRLPLYKTDIHQIWHQTIHQIPIQNKTHHRLSQQQKSNSKISKPTTITTQSSSDLKNNHKT
jgi:hypothetical protein